MQAATSSARHTSFQALLSLQRQLIKGNDSYDDLFRSRLSRVVVKLFSRVVKAEESVEDPYVQGKIDMEALICSLEDILASNENTIPSKTEDVSVEMIKSLLKSILSVQGSATLLRGLMEELDIDPITSALGKLLLQCDGDLGTIDAEIVTEPTVNIVPPKMTPSKDVASLVSQLGCAPPGEEREAALVSIRAYKLEYGDRELDTHLQQLSGPFREYIVEQINRDPAPMKKQMTNDTTTSGSNDSVSDRIRNLRSRLQASEMNSPQKAPEKIEEAVSAVPIEPDNSAGLSAALSALSFDAISEPLVTTNPEPSPEFSVRKNSNIAAPSPSKIPTLKVTVSTANNDNATTTLTTPESKIPLPGHRPSRLLGTSSASAIPSFSASSSSAQSLRDRLAARQGTTMMQPADHDDVLKSSIPSSSSSSLGRAAALRARLETVKQQSTSNNNNKQ